MSLLNIVTPVIMVLCVFMVTSPENICAPHQPNPPLYLFSLFIKLLNLLLFIKHFNNSYSNNFVLFTDCFRLITD